MSSLTRKVATGATAVVLGALAMGGQAVAAPADSTLFSLCNNGNGDYAVSAVFPDSGGFSSTMVVANSCWKGPRYRGENYFLHVTSTHNGNSSFDEGWNYTNNSDYTDVSTTGSFQDFQYRKNG
ncbi:hypothetical protein [Amycolatopsis sp. BJA-103]|uniref:hypothetical protein n=1 Tax=unclassified Amycolatopsis TaxID=2618356 RepID=UPI0011AF4671|nr:hypothetical protein [Amycolatopsis sp. BJA-103]